MVGLNKYVTVATDISRDSKHTTWACYIRYDGGVIKRVGQFKKSYKNTALAETHALANALTIAEAAVKDWSESKIIIYNEIEYVLKPIRTKSGQIRLRDTERAESIIEISLPILQRAKAYELRDVKAHYKNWKNSENPAKYAINRWCDTESRSLLRELRKGQKHQ